MSNMLISEIQKDTLLIFSLIPQKCYHAQEYELFACHTRWHVVQFILSCVNILFICISECLETYKEHNWHTFEPNIMMFMHYIKAGANSENWAGH